MNTDATRPLCPRDIVFHFGGPLNLVRLMERHGISPRPNHEQAKKWSQRDSIPGDYMLGLVALGNAIGKPLPTPPTTGDCNA